MSLVNLVNLVNLGFRSPWARGSLFPHRRQPRRSLPILLGSLDVELGFRDLKTVLEVRPVCHRKEDRIRAHVTLCFLALVLIRVAENATSDTWPAIARDLDRIHLIDLEGSAGRIRQRTEITDTQAHILTACRATTPPLILAAEPIRRRPRKTA